MRRYQSLLALVVGLFILSSSSAWAQFYIDGTFFPVYVNKNDVENLAGGSPTKDVPTEKGLGIDFRATLAYVFPAYYLALGATYNHYSVDTERALTADYEGLETATTRREYGPTLGMIFGGWKFFFTYLLSAEKSARQHYKRPTPPDQDETFKNSEGQGFQLSLGYGLNLGAGFTIGPSLIYRAVTYSKQSLTVHAGSTTPYASTTLRTKAVDTELKPMITVSYRY